MRAVVPSRLVRICACAAPLLVAACGGGRGDGGGVGGPPLTSAPGDAAVSQYLQAAHQATLTGTDTSGNSYTLQLSTTPSAGASTFNGYAGAHSRVVSSTISVNGVPRAPDVQTYHFLVDPYEPLDTGGSSEVVDSFVPLPTTVEVGTLETNIVSFSIQPNSPGGGAGADYFTVGANDSRSVLLCLGYAYSEDMGLLSVAQSDCYGVDALGDMQLISVNEEVSYNLFVVFK